MNEGHALRYLKAVMGWTFEMDNQETTWLRMISDFKYDSYRGFDAGSRFVESLLYWLQQFAPEDRQIAYDLVRNHLIFISSAEMQHLVNRAFSIFGRKLLETRLIQKTGAPPYAIWKDSLGKQTYNDLLKRMLVVGLSDGARIDGFRRANVGILSNEQVALGYELSSEKWQDLREELQSRTGDARAQFEVVMLIDDFMGSGKTLIRIEDSKWKGKLKKLAKSFSDNSDIFAEDCLVGVHHYIGTDTALTTVEELLLSAASATGGPDPWFKTPVKVSIDMRLRADCLLKKGHNPQIDYLVEKYYDKSIESKSMKVGGAEDARYGFAACSLPLILEHNTPNNSLSILWAQSETEPEAGFHKMRPLFVRRQRHS
jgi:hypothetical protein